jgi:Sensors of blue-light using FAD
MDKLRRVFYISRAAKKMSDADVQAILRISQRNNRRSDITGCLMYSGEFFAQTVEGSADAVIALVAKIALDARHTEVRVLLNERSDARLFPDWSMGLIYSGDLAERIAHWDESPEFSPTDAVSLMKCMKPDSIMGGL